MRKIPKHIQVMMRLQPELFDPDSDADWCSSVSPEEWICTRMKQHTGMHICYDKDERSVLDAWYQYEEKKRYKS